MTSGAWRLKQYAPGEKTVLEPNPYWFGVDQKQQRLPYLDELVFLDRSGPGCRRPEVPRRTRSTALDNVKPENYQWYAENQQKGNYTLLRSRAGPGHATSSGST